MQTEIIQLTTLAPRKRGFGEYLVENRVLDRFQLFRALQMQDRVPGARIGQCAVALGFVARKAIEQHHETFEKIDPFDNMVTGAFQKEFEVEVVFPIP